MSITFNAGFLLKYGYASTHISLPYPLQLHNRLDSWPGSTRLPFCISSSFFLLSSAKETFSISNDYDDICLTPFEWKVTSWITLTSRMKLGNEMHIFNWTWPSVLGQWCECLRIHISTGNPHWMLCSIKLRHKIILS